MGDAFVPQWVYNRLLLMMTMVVVMIEANTGANVFGVCINAT